MSAAPREFVPDAGLPDDVVIPAFLGTAPASASADRALLDRISLLEARWAAAEAGRESAYMERNRLVALLSVCFAAGVREHEEGEDGFKTVVYVDLPTGQASWHVPDSHASFFAHLPAYVKPYDGHTTEQKYGRIASLVTHPAARLLATVSAETMLDLSAFERAAIAERRRQVTVEGWTPARDDEHDLGELAAASAAYALAAADALYPRSMGEGDFTTHAPLCWPFDAKQWKHGTPHRMVEKAVALLLAEGDRLRRQGATE